MTQHQENERPQFSMSMFASREELFKAQMEWEIKEAVAAERERIAKQFDDEADRQEKVWNDFLATKQTDKHATTFHTIFRGISEAIRKGKP